MPLASSICHVHDDDSQFCAMLLSLICNNFSLVQSVSDDGLHDGGVFISVWVPLWRRASRTRGLGMLGWPHCK